MKKLFTFITLLLLSTSLFGCDTETTPKDTKNPVENVSTVEIVTEESYQVDVFDSTFDLKRFVEIKDDQDQTYHPNDSMIDYNDFDVNILGDYTVTITVLDSNFESVTKDITLSVVDDLIPTVLLNGSSELNIELGSDYNELGATLEDNYDDDLVLEVVGTVDVTIVGEYVLEYYTVDNSGNRSVSAYRTVTVYEGDLIVIDEDGLYISKDDVALYIYTYDKLPDNYMTKSEAGSHISSHWTTLNMASIGGDRFYNREGLLPEASGRYYTEVDINYRGGSRGAERIVYSNDGFIFYTGDHYDSFKLYDPETMNWVSYSKNDPMFD